MIVFFLICRFTIPGMSSSRKPAVFFGMWFFENRLILLVKEKHFNSGSLNILKDWGAIDN